MRTAFFLCWLYFPRILYGLRHSVAYTNKKAALRTALCFGIYLSRIPCGLRLLLTPKATCVSSHLTQANRQFKQTLQLQSFGRNF